MSKLNIIIPCYNNEESLLELYEQIIESERNYLKDNFDTITYTFIDDGSDDKTFEKLNEIKNKLTNKMQLIKMTGNFGSINAIMAGLKLSDADCYATLSADLQEPSSLVLKMFDEWKKGFKLVIAQRKSREDPFFTIVFSKIFHFLLRKLAIKDVPVGGFDLVLFDKKIKEYLIISDDKNSNLFYAIFQLRYKYSTIEYNRKKRKYGNSKWTLGKKLKLLIDSFVSFSYLPIRLISFFGLFLGGLSFLYGSFVIFARLIGLIPLQGWSALMIVLLFVSSFQMISIGIIGEYVWRALDATRNRPNYIIEEIY